jgi:hypothetical protein
MFPADTGDLVVATRLGHLLLLCRPKSPTRLTEFECPSPKFANLVGGRMHRDHWPPPARARAEPSVALHTRHGLCATATSPLKGRFRLP